MGRSSPQPGDGIPSCPFCAFSVPSNDKLNLWELEQHVQLVHLESKDSPFRVRDPSAHSRPSSRSSSSSRRSSMRNSLSGRAFGQESASRSRSRTPSPGDDDGDWYFACPVDGCDEAVHIREREQHKELHDSERLGLDEPLRPDSSDGTRVPPEHRGRKGSPGLLAPPSSGSPKARSASPTLLTVPSEQSLGSRSKSSSLKGLFLGPAPRKTRGSKSTPRNIKRLGKSELGPYAFEDKMPHWLFKQLQRGPKISVINQVTPRGRIVQVEQAANETIGLIDVLAQLCEQDSSLSKVFLCHPSVKHVYKTRREGGFCGYRNIQMQISFMQETGFPGSEHFPGRRLPTIPRLQDLIEGAWDAGFNSQGRVETGGVRGTRKYIGTPEAQAIFCSLGIGCEASAFNKPAAPDSHRTYVHDDVLEAVFAYFSTGVSDPAQKVYRTGLAPIYFQHPGHSLTIVGLEVRKRGLMNLLVFDPMFETPSPVVRRIGTSVKANDPARLLKAFRRGDSYLSKYNSFEILKLTAPRPILVDEMQQLNVADGSHAPLRGHGLIG